MRTATRAFEKLGVHAAGSRTRAVPFRGVDVDRYSPSAVTFDDEHAREKLQRGIVASAWIMAAIAAAFTLTLLAFLVVTVGIDGSVHRIAFWAHVGTVVFLLGVGVACRPSLSAAALRSFDAVATIGGGVGFSLFTIGASAAMGRVWVVLLYVAHALMLRAAVVPSSARRTMALGAAALLPTLIQAPFAARFSESGAPTVIFTILWIAATLSGSALVSQKIYGLERQVRRAVRLGQYTLEEKIGEGGMGEVYKARHALLRRPTAVKIIRPGLTLARTLERFEREVQLTSQLTHPSTVQIYDFGRSADGRFYYAMEYIEGLTLTQLVSLDGPQPSGRVAVILSQVCDSLAEAHAAGLIHRDVKPDNVLVCTRGLLADVVKVVDFGLAKSLQTPGSTDVVGMRIGTPQYMAPEAVLAPSRVDERTDVYAVGAIAYYLLTGAHLFSGASAAVLAQQVNTLPTRPSARLGAEVPRALEEVVLRCLAKDPAARPQSASELCVLLRESAGTWDADASRAWWERNQDAVSRVRAATAKTATGDGFRALTTRLVAP